MKVTVRVKPGSKKGPLVETDDDGSLTIYVREPAVDGKANAKVVELLAKHFGVPKSNMEIVHGHTAKIKLIEVQK